MMGNWIRTNMAKKKNEDSQIALYHTKDGKVQVEVNVQNDTVWLTLNQMTVLFERDKSVISRHLRNIFKSGELVQNAVVAKNATTASDGKTYQVDYFNLDAILSVGYRVNSKRGTQFRIWATNTLKQHLIDGYTLNQKQLSAHLERISEIRQALDLMTQITTQKNLSSDEADGLIRIVRDYAYGLDLIDAYDKQTVEVQTALEKKAMPIQYTDARIAIEQLQTQYQASDLFGREKDNSFKGSLISIFQTFDGKALYPSVEEKAAHLLYFLVKNHPFIDGNKRIAAFLFLWFLDKNNRLYKPDGSKRIADNALVALTLMTAVSSPKEKNMMIKIIINLINDKN